MIKYGISFFICTAFFALFAQENELWTSTFNKNESALEFHVKLKEGWHIYSVNNPVDAGPVHGAATLLQRLVPGPVRLVRVQPLVVAGGQPAVVVRVDRVRAGPP